MFSIRFSKRNVFAIVVGFAVIVLIGIVTSLISFYCLANLGRILGPDNYLSALSQQPYLAISWFLDIIKLLSPLAGGFVVGRIVKQKGWLYGGLLGIVLTAISIGFVSLTFILPTSLTYGNQFPAGYAQSLAQKNILNQLLHSPITVILTGLGGYISDFLNKRNRKNK